MLTAEQREIRALAREFAGSEIRPRAAAWDEARALDDGIFSQLAELGFLGMLVPEAHGGLGLDPLTYLVAVEELSWGDPVVGLQVSVQNGLVATAILEHGSDEQRERWLPALAAGETLGAFALSEPGAGSDAAALETRAEPDGDAWVLRGRKKWVTNGDRADRIVVFARTGEER
ncbi:MAG TPA: acyl-CoA dehydrogenase family protein, partial [Longimicrobiales bacterium]|nr:acyl-CoA dehydrogenase family protein [Longimicrobiales bacterium]